MISEAYTSPLLIISKIRYSNTPFLICTAILSFSYIIHSLKIKKYTTLHYKVVYNYMERKIKRNKSDFLRSKKRKAIFFIFLFKKPKKSILELNLINHFTNYLHPLIILSHLNFSYQNYLSCRRRFLDLSHGHYLKKQVYGHWNIHKKLSLSLSS